MASLLLGLAACFTSGKDKLTSKRHREAQAKLTIIASDDPARKTKSDKASSAPAHTATQHDSRNDTDGHDKELGAAHK